MNRGLSLNWTRTFICSFDKALSSLTLSSKSEVEMDNKTLKFVTRPISKLSEYLKIPQGEVFRRLYTSGILYDYIVPSYDVLHTFSSRYLLEDVTDYMREEGVL